MIKSMEQFENDCLAVIEQYQSDLYQDIELIKQGKPCIFYAYWSGSHAVQLHEFEYYPADGQRVPYLFGTADRWHIMKQTGATQQCDSVQKSKLVHYFDGQKIRQITIEKGAEIIADYQWKMAQQFHKHNGLKTAA